jgi:hypothetical protein
VLDAFARRSSDHVWTLSTASLIAAVDAGRTPGELAAFLNERAVHGTPPTVGQLLVDVEDRAGCVRDLGLMRVIECADPVVATLLSRDRTLRGVCSRNGERHLILDPAAEPKGARRAAQAWLSGRSDDTMTARCTPPGVAAGEYSRWTNRFSGRPSFTLGQSSDSLRTRNRRSRSVAASRRARSNASRASSSRPRRRSSSARVEWR